MGDGFAVGWFALSPPVSNNKEMTIPALKLDSIILFIKGKHGRPGQFAHK